MVESPANQTVTASAQRANKERTTTGRAERKRDIVHSSGDAIGDGGRKERRLRIGDAYKTGGDLYHTDEETQSEEWSQERFSPISASSNSMIQGDESLDPFMGSSCCHNEPKTAQNFVLEDVKGTHSKPVRGWPAFNSKDKDGELAGI